MLQAGCACTALWLFSAQNGRASYVWRVHAKQEAPCFQPLVVHWRACRSVPDGAGGPLRALPCPPISERASQNETAGAVLASLSRRNLPKKCSKRQKVSVPSVIRAGAWSSTLRFVGAKLHEEAPGCSLKSRLREGEPVPFTFVARPMQSELPTTPARTEMATRKSECSRWLRVTYPGGTPGARPTTCCSAGAAG